jgi:hypothetical protein
MRERGGSRKKTTNILIVVVSLYIFLFEKTNLTQFFQRAHFKKKSLLL